MDSQSTSSASNQNDVTEHEIITEEGLQKAIDNYLLALRLDRKWLGGLLAVTKEKPELVIALAFCMATNSNVLHHKAFREFDVFVATLDKIVLTIGGEQEEGPGENDAIN